MRSTYPHISAPSRQGSSPIICTREVTKTFATGSCPRTSSTSPTSRSSSSRSELVRSIDIPRRLGLLGARLGALFGQTHCLFHERLDDLGFGHGLDDFATHEDLALAVAGRHAEVGLARLAGPVHHTTHDRNAESCID